MRYEQLSVSELTVNTINGYSFPAGLGVGNIYYACLSYYTGPYTLLNSRFRGKHYSDGSSILHTTIASAVSATVSGRNDYVIVSPGPWGITEAIDLSAKTDVHLIGAGGLTQDVGSSGPAYIVQTGNYEAIKVGSWCEVAGLQVWNKDGYSAITLGNVQGCNIHHNFIRMVGGAASTVKIIDATSVGYGCNYNRIHHNKLHHYAGATLGTAIAVGLGTGNDTDHNEIFAFGSLVLGTGISNMSAGGSIKFNVISECGGAGASGGGTITIAINSKNAGTVIGNRCAVAAGQALEGGTAAHSFVDNMDGASGATNGAASNLET